MTLDLVKAIKKYLIYDAQLSDHFDEGDVWYDAAPNARTATREVPLLIFAFIPSGNPERGFDGGRIESLRVQFTIYHDDFYVLLEIIDRLSDQLDRAKLPLEGSTKQNLSMMALGAPLVRSEPRTPQNKFAYSATRDFEAKVQI